MTGLPRVAIVACSKEKADHAAPARDLYQGALFKAARAYAEATCDSWLIVSAQHGLVDPARVLEPYDRSLASMDREQRKGWGQRTGRELAQRFGYGAHDSTPTATFVALAGAGYMDVLAEGMFRAYQATEFPLRGIGIGQQKAWLAANTPKRDPDEDERLNALALALVRTLWRGEACERRGVDGELRASAPCASCLKTARTVRRAFDRARSIGGAA